MCKGLPSDNGAKDGESQHTDGFNLETYETLPRQGGSLSGSRATPSGFVRETENTWQSRNIQ